MDVNTPPLILVLVWMAWVTQALAGARLSRHVREVLSRPEPEEDARHRPRAHIVVPVNGLEDNPGVVADSLQAQQYADFQVLFVVEGRNDPVYPVVDRLVRERTGLQARVIIAGRSRHDEGQKVHNLLAALDVLESESRDEDAWVFVDADVDAMPDSEWLGHLVGPLRRRRLAVTTGYRWLLPRARVEGVRPSVWTLIASAINGSAACAIAYRRTTRAWGGLMAVTAGTARQGRLRAYWRGSVADDCSLSAMASALGREVRFIPRCLVVTRVAWDFRELLEFAYRQYLIARVYVPKNFILGLSFTWLYTVGTFTAWSYTAVNLAGGSMGAVWSLGAMVVVLAANQVRATARREIVRAALGEDGLRESRSALALDRWATFAWMGVNALLMLRACFGRSVCWRGIPYRLDGPGRTERLDATPAGEQ